MESTQPTSQPWLEAMTPESGLEVYENQQHQAQAQGPSSSNQQPSYGSDKITTPGIGSQYNRKKSTVLGLSVRAFWLLVVGLVIVLAAGIGGGLGGGLAPTSRQNTGGSSGTDDDGTSSTSSTPTAPSSSPTSSSTSPSSSATPDPLLPTDGGCPGINNKFYTAYGADGAPVALQAGSNEGQEFTEQCYTNWVNVNGSSHDIFRTYTPELEQCIVVCAEYNAAYVANVKSGLISKNGGGGLCVAVTLVKMHAGFCYLKNGTTTNDTMGAPDGYSSAILITDIDGVL
ncbi:hypothetical protein F5Y16DRAFT_378316 [Xylariaceae sp. FL0255]|nr:hypothetical protein F5Y16DRAFT_378316 [Xylariaceae sp. FL0255]